MEYFLLLGDRRVSYELTYKKIRRINFRIASSGKVSVSAPFGVSLAQVEDVIRSKANWIRKGIVQAENRIKNPALPCYEEDTLFSLIHRLCRSVYPHYQARGIPYPQIRFRSMTSQWGNCRPKQGILTFNKNLRYAPYECIQYVVWHEWTHFLVPDHSPHFYEELSLVCPDWAILKQRLKEIIIP